MIITIGVFWPGSSETVQGVVVSALTVLLAIVFSISLVAVQYAADKYTPRILEKYRTDKYVLLSFGIFVVSILWGTIVMVFRWYHWGGYVSFIAMTACLVSLYILFTRVVTFVNPIPIIEDIKQEGMMKEDRGSIRANSSDLQQIAEKSLRRGEYDVTLECVQALRDICKACANHQDNTTVDDPIRRIGEIGVVGAREGIGNVPVRAIESLEDVGKEFGLKNIGSLKNMGQTHPIIVGEILKIYRASIGNNIDVSSDVLWALFYMCCECKHVELKDEIIYLLYIMRDHVLERLENGLQSFAGRVAWCYDQFIRKFLIEDWSAKENWSKAYEEIIAAINIDLILIGAGVIKYISERTEREDMLQIVYSTISSIEEKIVKEEKLAKLKIDTEYYNNVFKNCFKMAIEEIPQLEIEIKQFEASLSNKHAIGTLRSS